MVLAVESLFPLIELFEALETEYAFRTDWIRQQATRCSLKTIEAFPIRWKIPSAHNLHARVVLHACHYNSACLTKLRDYRVRKFIRARTPTNVARANFAFRKDFQHGVFDLLCGLTFFDVRQH